MLIPSLITLCVALVAALIFLGCRRAAERSDAQVRIEALEVERHRALDEQLSQQQSLFNALSDPFFLIDSGGVVRFTNTVGEALFPNLRIIDRRLDEVFRESRLQDPIRQALSEKVRVTTQVILSQRASPPGAEERSGETSWLVDASPVDPESSDPLIRVIIRDTTTERHTEQIRKDFVANASHELRTPLAIINGYLENLIEEEILDDRETALRFLKIMRKHGQRIARIVEDMLIISRLESDEANTLKVNPFRLEACVHDVVERLESVIASQGAKVKIDGGDLDLRLLGDRFYWTQVLFNLVENALKQNPAIPLAVEVGWKQTPAGLTMWVSDNGVGIPSADLPFIFRRFYRVEKHHSQEEIKGTGLGLSIVRRAIEAHGGKIEVTSTPGQETRFEIILPGEAIAPPDSEPNDNNPAVSR